MRALIYVLTLILVPGSLLVLIGLAICVKLSSNRRIGTLNSIGYNDRFIIDSYNSKVRYYEKTR
jgi:hypothetical protein